MNQEKSHNLTSRSLPPNVVHRREFKAKRYFTNNPPDFQSFHPFSLRIRSIIRLTHHYSRVNPSITSHLYRTVATLQTDTSICKRPVASMIGRDERHWAVSRGKNKTLASSRDVSTWRHFVSVCNVIRAVESLYGVTWSRTIADELTRRMLERSGRYIVYNATRLFSLLPDAYGSRANR